MLADAMLDNVAKDRWGTTVALAAVLEPAAYQQAAYEISERRARRVTGRVRSSVRYTSTKPSDAPLKAMAHEHWRLCRIPPLAADGWRELDAIVARRGRRTMIVSDNVTEFTSNAILAWADRAQVGWH